MSGGGGGGGGGNEPKKQTISLHTCIIMNMKQISSVALIMTDRIIIP